MILIHRSSVRRRAEESQSEVSKFSGFPFRCTATAVLVNPVAKQKAGAASFSFVYSTSSVLRGGGRIRSEMPSSYV